MLHKIARQVIYICIIKGVKIINHRQHRQPHILIVDDDREMLALLGKVIGRKCKCELKFAVSGRDAAEVLKKTYLRSSLQI
ncbi:MAG: hypothetical protein ACUVQ6_08295 [Dissulfurimicrobium sp.]|uniref:hypothetical protein n=1 Tax=Dissulfurimicrobium sp. TaxID=2022436 RepID=UPI00404B5C5B